ncbi:MAG TPA: ABC transporter permease [Longimicrobiales bacterium]|nr:ABC transporter permease [Longimicrobiales bacterium]
MNSRRSHRGGVFPRFDAREDVDREIRAHLDLRAEELEAEGWEPAAAREEARRVFGDEDSVARACRAIAASHQRAVRRGRVMDAIGQDLRFAVRTLFKSPGFALVALVTLSLGIGANTAVFSVVSGVLLRPLPFDDPEELVWLQEIGNHGGTMSVAWPNYTDWRDQSTSFAALAAVNDFNATVLGGDEPVRADGLMVGEDYWKVFPTSPLQGRLTVAADHVPGAPAVVVVSRSFWANQLGGRPLDGQSLEVLGIRVQVVGVVADGAGYPTDTQLWTPAEPLNNSTSRTSHNWSVVGRLAAGVPVGRARDEIDLITKRITALPDEDPDFLATGAAVVPLMDEIVGDLRQPLYLLLGAAVLVLLVACTNLASTLLARGASRSRELAVRASLGAGRARITRQLLTESLLLSVMGGAGGVGLAYLVVVAIRRSAPAFLPRLGEVALSPSVLVFTAAATVLTALLFGLLPALRLTKVEAGEALRAGSRGNAMDGRALVWRFLVGTEVALALVLLVGSGLLVRSFRTLLGEDLGFDAADVAVVSVSLSNLKYPEPEDHGRFYDELLGRVAAVPGAGAVGLISDVPLRDGLANGRLELDGDLDKQAIGAYVVASGGVFEVLDIPLLAGRVFDGRDGPDGEMVAMVSESFADRFWPGEDPVGKQVTGGGMDNFYPVRQESFARVVGVVADIRHRDVGREAYPTVYFPYTQRPYRIQYGASVLVESASGEPTSMAPELRSVLRAADPDIPVRMGSLGAIVASSLGERRFLMFVMGGFSVLALVLATVGIFGVVSYSVGRRRREIGIRVALGAAPESVVRMVVRAAMTMVAGGLVAGLVAALAMTSAMRSFLYEISPTDPLAVGAAVVTLFGAAVFASWLPARSGTRVDPMVTMRSE